MRSAKLAATVLLTVSLLGCGLTDTCTEKTEVVEVVDGEVTEGLAETQLEFMRENGWDCEGEPLRNAFGNRIGTRYTCTICE